MNTLRIATRKSPLALWQAHYVKTLLEAAHPHVQVEIIGLMTEGDKLLTTPLVEIGGKGLFVKELEKAILERRADIAVHSIKDMPATLTDRLILATVCEREDPRDAFVSQRFARLEDLPLGALVGTSSSRRTCQLKMRRPDLQVENLRGNVGTRLHKLDQGRYDAIILAAAGLKRLGQASRIRAYFDPEDWIPAVAQGAIGIECHQNNHLALELLAPLEHPPTRTCITAERAMNLALNGGCQLPIGAYATLTEKALTLRGMLGDPKHHTYVTATLNDPNFAAATLGQILAEKLISALNQQ